MFNKVHNPETGRMVKTSSKKGKELLKKYASGEYKTIRNPVTGKSVMTGGALGKKLLKRFAGGTPPIPIPDFPNINNPLYNLLQFSKEKIFDDMDNNLKRYLEDLPKLEFEKLFNINKNNIDLTSFNNFIQQLQSNDVNTPKGCISFSSDLLNNKCDLKSLLNMFHKKNDITSTDTRFNKVLKHIQTEGRHPANITQEDKIALDSMITFLNNVHTTVQNRLSQIKQQIQENNAKYLYYLQHYYYTKHLPKDHLLVMYEDWKMYDNHMSHFKDYASRYLEQNVYKSIDVYLKSDFSDSINVQVTTNDDDSMFGFENNNLYYVNNNNFANVLVPHEFLNGRYAYVSTLEDEWEKIQTRLAPLFEVYRINMEKLTIESKYDPNKVEEIIKATIKKVSESRK